MKSIVIYFSRADENYFGGQMKYIEKATVYSVAFLCSTAFCTINKRLRITSKPLCCLCLLSVLSAKLYYR